MTARAYLDRIGVEGMPGPTAGTLVALHLAHLHTVPFENLDIHAGVPIVLDPDAVRDKVVEDRRGGYCYEVNGAFAGLLRELGFGMTLAQCRVHGEDGWTPRFDHLALVVSVPDRGDWLVDVGFGDSFLVPHELGATWSEPGRRYRTVPQGRHWILERDDGDGWAPQYDLDPTARTLDEFAPRSLWHETSAASPFRRRAIATRAIAGGRVTVADRRLVLTSGPDRTERDLADHERHGVVTTWFGSAVADAVEAAATARAG